MGWHLERYKRQRKVLHVANPSPLIPPYIELINAKVAEGRHEFWINGTKENCKVEPSEQIYIRNGGVIGTLKAYSKLIVELHTAKKVILHGLFNPRLVIILATFPWLLPKCYWNVWGGDLYTYQAAKRGWKWHLIELFRRPVIKKVGYLVTGTSGDVRLARKWYGAEGEHIVCFNYPTNLYRPYPNNKENKATLNVMVGNSSDPTNNHLGIFNRLKGSLPENSKVFCPLSYGDKSYADRVIEEGNALLGEKFYPLTDFMNFDQYIEFISTIDVAVFDHNRQQAFGNTILLLGFGKKVYINPSSTLNELFQQFGIKVYDSTRIDLTSIEPNVLSENQKLIERFFSERALVENLRAWIN